MSSGNCALAWVRRREPEGRSPGHRRLSVARREGTPLEVPPRWFHALLLFTRKSPAPLRKEVCWCVMSYIPGRHYLFGARLYINLFASHFCQLVVEVTTSWEWHEGRMSLQPDENWFVFLDRLHAPPIPTHLLLLPVSHWGRNWHLKIQPLITNWPTLSPLHCKACLSCGSHHFGCKEFP